MRARGLALLVVLSVVAVAAPAASAATRASGVISGSGTSYLLTVDNTGDQPIYCLRFFAAQGVTITAATAPATLEGPDRFSAQPTLAPGSSITYAFTTAAAYPVGAGGTLNVSTTCTAGSDVSSAATGPDAPPGGGAPAPCLCSDLTAVLTDPSIHAHHGRYLAFDMDWKLVCGAGTGKGCAGTFAIRTSPADVSFTSPRSRKVQCAGPCAKTTSGTSRLQLLLPKRLRPLEHASAAKRRKHRRAYPPLRIRLDLSCIDAAGAPKLVHRTTFTVRFDRYGQVNRKTSDLNGDGVADRRKR